MRYEANISRLNVCVLGILRGVHLTLDLDFTLLENQVGASDALPDILDVLDNSLEVGGGIVRASDEDVVLLAVAGRGVDGADGDELVVDGT